MCDYDEVHHANHPSGIRCRDTTRVLVVVTLAFALCASIVSATERENALDTIATYAERICNKVPLESEDRKFEINAGVEAELSGLARLLASITPSASGTVTREVSTGVLKENLADLLVNNANCKARVAKRLERRFFSDSPRADDVVNSILTSRRGQYEAVIFEVTQSQSCTNGRSGKRKRATMRVTCPDYAVVSGTPHLVKEVGGCYGPTATDRGATAIVSQTGDGRTACTLVITCKLSSVEIESKLLADAAHFRGATASNVDLLATQLSRIYYPSQSVRGVACHES